jgi:protein-tyrosine phosphatase
MIDLHSHILFGLDDGPPDIEASLAMAAAAVADGTRQMVATPHVSGDYDYELDEIGRLTGELNARLAREEVPLAILPGAEIALSRLPRLTDTDLAGLSLGGGGSILVESPYTSSAPFLDEALFEIQIRGFHPMLAHPERSPVFQSKPDRLRQLVARGVLCSITAGSLAGRFGSRARAFSNDLLSERLVHSVDSDAHDADRRRPGLSEGIRAAEEEFPGIAAQADWYVRAAPTAILAGKRPPAMPDAPQRRRRSALGRLLGRR